MPINADCIPCMTKMVLNLTRRLRLDPDSTKKVFTEIMKTPALRGQEWNITSGEIVEQAMLILSKTVGRVDPFKEDKERQNQMVMESYPYFQELMKCSPEPLYEAVKLAILGNAIDFVTTSETPDIKKTIDDCRDAPLSREDYEPFLDKLKTSKKILYIGDNSGEIVLDKLLIELLARQYGLDVTFAVRSRPTMNDVTLEEARSVGMDQVATLIENGVDGPLAGTLLRRVSQEMREKMDRADLIISKGGANFESLHPEHVKLNTDISFLVVSKCRNYINLFHIPIGDPVLKNMFIE